MSERDAAGVPESEREQVEEAEKALDEVNDEPTPDEQAELRRQIALEVEGFEQGIQG